jgi:lincosamide nucleotidyltransferase A/C/D/E
MFPAELVVEVLDVLPDAIVDGGWGVDALVGEQTRPHADLDLVVPLATLDPTLAALARLGFAVDFDEQPTRVVVVRGDGTQIDLHLVTPSDNGPVQALPSGQRITYALGTAAGHIGGCEVACLPAPTHLVVHLGYEPDADDVADMMLLRDRLGLSLSPPFISATGDDPIRSASLDDVAAVAAIRHRSWKSAYAGLMPDAVLDAMDIGANLARDWSFVSSPPTARHGVLVAGEPGSVVGIAVMGPEADDDDVAVIYRLYMDPTAYGLGIGARLLAEATEWLQQRDYKQLTLWVLDGNVRAQRFYEREGWQCDGTRLDESVPEGSWTSVRYRLPFV